MNRITVFDKEFMLHIPLLITPEMEACPYVVVNGKFTRQVTAYYSLQGDLLEAQAMIFYLKENPVIPMVVKASMFKAFIAQYAKCFTSAKGRKVKLEPGAVFSKQEDLLEIHKEVMDIRHNYIAHAGEGKYEYGAMVVHLNPDFSNPLLVGSIYAELKFMDHSRKLSGYDDLCKIALEYVKSKLEKLFPSYDKALDSMDLQELYSKSKTPKRKDWNLTTLK